MKILVVHLSDIHIRSEEDLVLLRPGNIASAVGNLEPSLEGVVLLMSGDVSFSGQSEEYSLALTFFESLHQHLREYIAEAIPIYLAMVPGNHDCDFSSSQAARGAVLDAVKGDPSICGDASVVNICTSVQKCCFEFAETVQALFAPLEVGNAPQLAWEHRIEISGKSIAIKCLNTAWMSRLHEQQGDLLFPVDLFTSLSEGESDFVISTFHHPYNWVEANNARELRKAVEGGSDFTFIGHEHDSTYSKQEFLSSTTSVLIEGGALQSSSGSTDSCFNAVVLDLANFQHRFVQFSWGDDCYVRREAPGVSVADPLPWMDFVPLSARNPNQFSLNEEFEKSIDDPGVSLIHGSRGRLVLSDIFVPPDLREVRNVGSDLPVKVVKSGAAFEALQSERFTHIRGQDQSGRTCLAKSLFATLLSSGRVPILLDGKKQNIPLASDQFSSFLERQLCDQYSSLNLEAFRQLPVSKRTVIIDDFHEITVNSKARKKFVAVLEQFCSQIILFSRDIEASVLDLSHPDNLGGEKLDFKQYEIMPFGIKRRNDLVEKWMLLDRDAEENTAAFLRQLDFVTQTLDTLFGKNYLPAYPAYILAVLQATEATTEIDINASTHGYLYEILIKSALARRTSRTNYNVIQSYLSSLSHHIYMSGKKEIDISEFVDFHKGFEGRFEISRSFKAVSEELVDNHILDSKDDVFRFRHPYIRYYFIASYIRDHLHEGAIKDLVAEMATSLYKTESANVLLFLAHLSKDPYILECLLNSADSLFGESATARLESDVGFLNNIDSEVEKLEVVVVSHIEERRRRLDLIESTENVSLSPEDEEQVDPPQGDESVTEYLARLNAAVKTIQILGQILKNFPASIDGDQKLKIVNATAGLGFRCVGDVMELLCNNKEEAVKEMIDVIKPHHPGADDREMAQRASKAVVQVAELFSFGMIKRLSYSLGSRELTQTYRRFAATNEDASSQLLHASLLLDHASPFPKKEVLKLKHDIEGNPFAYRILRYLVIRHLNIFPVSFNIRQSVCEKLNISFRSTVTSPRERKLI